MRLALAAAALLPLLGCASEEPPPPPVLSVEASAETPLQERDADDFLRLAGTLGPEALRPLAEVLPEPSAWPADSTRTVAGLAGRERAAVARRLRGADLAAAVSASADGPRLLADLGWSAGRFASVGAAFGVATAANDLTDARELERLRAEAERKVAPLADDHRVYGGLSAADAAAVQRRAAWLPRLALLEALLGSAPENRTLVHVRADDFATVLPAGFDRTALDRLLSDRERSAIPFHDHDPLRDDALLRWDGAAVVVAEEGGRPD